MANDKYTLRTLCESYKKIEIPILQREYAQGRASAKHTRERFVEHLTEVLKNNTPIELDFVYGAERDGVFVPLDGQQRLTTLWLLHWLLAAKEGRIEEVSRVLRKFVYESRPAALTFCENLLTLTDVPQEAWPHIDQYLTDLPWFADSWHQDASVAGMVEMLRTLASQTALLSEQVTLDQLWRAEPPIISFYFLNIENFGMTDELYIRMNARGEQLTDFEHFKSEFYKIIAHHPEVEEIKRKMENEWVEALWEMRPKGTFVTDAPFMRLLAFVSKMLAIGDARFKDEELPDNFCDLNFVRQLYANAAHVDFLVWVLDNLNVWTNVRYDALLASSELELHSLQNITASLLCEKGDQMTADESIIVFAMWLYMRKYPEEQQGLLHFIRVVRNLIVHTDDKGAREQRRMLPALVSMVNADKDVYEVLRTTTQISGFRNEMVEHEHDKAHKMASLTDDEVKAMQEMEDLPVFNGNLRTLFEGAKVDGAWNFDMTRLISTKLNELLNVDKKLIPIWGNLLTTSMYQYTYADRIYWHERNYRRHPSVLDVARKWGESGMAHLNDFLRTYDALLIEQLANKTPLAQLTDPKQQMFVLYLIARRVMKVKAGDFWQNGYRIAWNKVNGHTKTIFSEMRVNGGVVKSPWLFQLYERRKKTLKAGEEKGHCTPAERKYKPTYLDELVAWAKENAK